MKNKLLSKQAFLLAALVAIGAGAGVSAIVSAKGVTSGNDSAQHRMMDKRGPGIMGTVSSVNGTTILVAGKAKDGTVTNYTVDASTATFKKAMAVATIADVKAGDMVAVQGTVTGTTVKATNVFVGVFDGGRGGMGGPGMIQGSRGTVSAVNGNSVTATFTDASKIKVGDSVHVIPTK